MNAHLLVFIYSVLYFYTKKVNMLIWHLDKVKKNAMNLKYLGPNFLSNTNMLPQHHLFFGINLVSPCTWT
jgi:hypothetical protein